jgi:hypothetical protein
MKSSNESTDGSRGPIVYYEVQAAELGPTAYAVEGTVDESARLLEWLASCSRDPYAFVLGAFPWGEPGTRLTGKSGPEPWQARILWAIRDGLLDISTAIQLATASGHGVGKSCCVSWIILWALLTKDDTKGVVTANTETQLKTKTWAELGKWYHMLAEPLREQFKLTATALFNVDRERTWRIDMVPWSERNTEAFAGLHNQGKRILLVFDEASAIPDIIWETAEGALTDADTQIIWVVFGNPTRNTGRFRECFPGGKFASFWNSRQVDSRDVSFTNKKLFEKWIIAYGEDSDFVRIRVRGVFPRVGEQEFISLDVVTEAMLREPVCGKSDPLVLGVDVARFGTAESVIYVRKGRDGATYPPVRMQGLSTTAVAARTVALANELNADAIFVDGGGVGGGVVDQIRNLGTQCFDIQFGAKPDGVGFAWGVAGEKFANKRAEMWGAMRGWLNIGSIPADQDLKDQLVGPTYTLNVQNAILLEPKEHMADRGIPSPDIADALALTFALPVANATIGAGGLHEYGHQPDANVVSEYDPHSLQRLNEAFGISRAA